MNHTTSLYKGRSFRDCHSWEQLGLIKQPRGTKKKSYVTNNMINKLYIFHINVFLCIPFLHQFLYTEMYSSTSCKWGVDGQQDRILQRNNISSCYLSSFHLFYYCIMNVETVLRVWYLKFSSNSYECSHLINTTLSYQLCFLGGVFSLFPLCSVCPHMDLENLCLYNGTIYLSITLFKYMYFKKHLTLFPT